MIIDKVSMDIDRAGELLSGSKLAAHLAHLPMHMWRDEAQRAATAISPHLEVDAIDKASLGTARTLRFLWHHAADNLPRESSMLLATWQ